MAEGIGVTFQHVQKYEKGTNRIGSSRPAQIALVLGTRPGSLFGKDEAGTSAAPRSLELRAISICTRGDAYGAGLLEPQVTDRLEKSGSDRRIPKDSHPLKHLCAAAALSLPTAKPPVNLYGPRRSASHATCKLSRGCPRLRSGHAVPVGGKRHQCWKRQPIRAL